MKQMLFPLVLLAGGLATRLRPLTETLPKSLVDINGEPFISHQLKLLRANGINEVVICTGYLGEMISDFVGDGKRFDMAIRYSQEQDTLLGTAGAIKQALPLLDDDFFVLYGDSYLPCDYASVQSFFVRSQLQGLMTVFRNNGQWDKSNVEFSENRILVYDKKNQTPRMHYIDYGLGIFNKRAFDTVPEQQPYDLAVLYQQLLQDGQLAGYEVKERFYEAGSFNGIKELEAIINNKKESEQWNS